jgi:hypothetical protein
MLGWVILGKGIGCRRLGGAGTFVDAGALWPLRDTVPRSGGLSQSDTGWEGWLNICLPFLCRFFTGNRG